MRVLSKEIRDLCIQAKNSVLGKSVDATDILLKHRLRECANAFYFAANRVSKRLNASQELETAKKDVYHFSSTDVSELMLPYQKTQMAFCILQGAANRLSMQTDDHASAQVSHSAPFEYQPD